MDFFGSAGGAYTQENIANKISMREVVGGGYDEFWRSTKRYVVCKGSRASKKSTTAALKLVVRIMQRPQANALVVRQTAATLSNSCYAQLKWAINRLGVERFWKATVNPLQLVYIPTGQKILFRGCDDSLKITSIAVEKGHLCFCWLEEAYEVSEEDFRRIDESLRGKLPIGYYIQWLITFNPWSSSSWLKARFFDNPDKNTLALTTNYTCNEFLSDEDRELYEEIKLVDPDRAKVVCYGDWGIESGQYFSMWRESKHVVKPFEIPKEWVKFRAMDFGQAKPYAVIWFAVDFDGNLYAYRELYGWGGKPNVGTGETAKQIGERIAGLETPDEGLSYGVLDSACWAKTGVSGPTIEEELNKVLIENKLVPFMKSSKGRLEGADAFKQRLIGNVMEDGTYKPAIYFFSTCIHCIRTIPMVGHDKHKPELPDTDAEDHCFIAGTMINTERGEIPIEDVTLADKVLTRKGFRKVLAAGMTKHDAQVVTVTFSNGKSLTGTGNHPIFIKEKGFVTLDSVKYGDIIYGTSEVNESCPGNKNKQQNWLCLTASRLGVTPTQRILPTEIIIERTVGSILKALFTCTGKFGSFSTAKSPTAITSITKTEIRLITTFLIWNYLRNMTIFPSTCRKILPTMGISNEQEHTWTPSETKPPNGTGRTQDANGIAGTELMWRQARRKNRKLNAFAFNVEKNFLPSITDALTANTVPRLVTPNTDVTAVLTTKPESAQFAARRSELIDTEAQKPVAENAVHVLAVKKEEKKVDVYNLTVDGEHEYFANGFLVHNCLDGILYGVMSRPWKPVKKKKKDEREREETRRSPWTY